MRLLGQQTFSRCHASSSTSRRRGFVSVRKSTLINQIVGQKLADVERKDFVAVRSPIEFLLLPADVAGEDAFALLLGQQGFPPRHQ